MITSTTQVQDKPPWLWRWFVKLQNPFMKWLLRSPFHGVVSRIYLLITFSGRKSGTLYTTPVQYKQQGSTVYIITSAGYTWWKHLRGGAEVQLRIRGKSYRGHALTAEDAASINAQLAQIYPGFNAERRAKFTPGKVAITVTLQTPLEESEQVERKQ